MPRRAHSRLNRKGNPHGNLGTRKMRFSRELWDLWLADHNVRNGHGGTPPEHEQVEHLKAGMEDFRRLLAQDKFSTRTAHIVALASMLPTDLNH